MRRILLMLAVAALLIAALAVPVFADEGGEPNQNGCFGQDLREANLISSIPLGENVSEHATTDPEDVYSSRGPYKIGCALK